MCGRFDAALIESNMDKLGGIFEVDETYVGRVRGRSARERISKPGRGTLRRVHRAASRALEAFIDESIRLFRRRAVSIHDFSRDVIPPRHRGSHRALRVGGIQTGFRKLKALGLLDWSIEAAVISSQPSSRRPRANARNFGFVSPATRSQKVRSMRPSSRSMMLNWHAQRFTLALGSRWQNCSSLEKSSFWREAREGPCQLSKARFPRRGRWLSFPTTIRWGAVGN